MSFLDASILLAMQDPFFQGWYDIGRIFLVGIPAYALLILLLRISGKRTLSKLNAFDLVITVGFGTALASTLLDSAVSLSEGVALFAFLILAQFSITWLSVRSERFQGLVKATPSLLFYQGREVPGALRRERVTREEVLSAVRSEGYARVEDTAAVVLETDGSLNVLQEVPPPGEEIPGVGLE